MRRFNRTLVWVGIALFSCSAYLTSMDIMLELEAKVPNKCSVMLEKMLPSIEFRKSELREGIVRDDLLTLNIQYNRMDPFCLIMEGAKETDKEFYFENDRGGERILFYLYDSDTLKSIKPGSVVYQREQIDTPFEEHRTLSIAIPEGSHKYLTEGSYRAHFEVTMKPMK